MEFWEILEEEERKRMEFWEILEEEERKRKGGSKNPRDNRYMPWGKHRGTLIREIPHEYFLWLLEEDRGEPLDTWLRDEADARNISRERIKKEKERYKAKQEAHSASRRASEDASRGNSHLQQSITAWLARIAKEYHPDRGGSDEQMAVVNEVRRSLIELLKQQGLWE